MTKWEYYIFTACIKLRSKPLVNVICDFLRDLVFKPLLTH